MKYIRRYWYVGFCLVIAAVGISAEIGSTAAMSITDTIVGGIVFVAGIILFLAICFAVTAWISLGNPFWEKGDTKPTVVFRDHRKKDTKKMCPICRRPTHCKVQRSANGHFFVHVVKG